MSRRQSASRRPQDAGGFATSKQGCSGTSSTAHRAQVTSLRLQREPAAAQHCVRPVHRLDTVTPFSRNFPSLADRAQKLKKKPQREVYLTVLHEANCDSSIWIMDWGGDREITHSKGCFLEKVQALRQEHRKSHLELGSGGQPGPAFIKIL